MAIIELFSTRQRRLRGEVADVLYFDKLPREFRVQVVYVFKETLGTSYDVDRNSEVATTYKFLTTALCREYGTFVLPGTKDRHTRDYVAELLDFILTESDVERVIDAIELGCRMIDLYCSRFDYKRNPESKVESQDALKEINARFLQHGIGFRYESRNIIRVDSEFVHAEVVKPALALLHDPRFAGAEAEFRLAFEHYRHARMKEALSECLKTLESMMKSIAAARNWTHAPNATAKNLLDLMYEKQLIPQFWAEHFTGLRSMLASGVPTARNRLAGHGQGVDVVDVPAHFVAFALHQTAAAIVLLATAEQVLP